MSSPHADFDPPPLDADLGALVEGLQSLRPRGLDPGRRDAILVAAGRASEPQRTASSRVWPALAASLGLVAVGEGALLARRPPPSVVERIVVVREPAPVVAPSAPPVVVGANATGHDSAPVGDRPRHATTPDGPVGPDSRFDRAGRSAAWSLGPPAPRWPGPSGSALRRELFRQPLVPSGDAS